MSRMWEVDPETKAKLQELQKQDGNNVCVDCGAPSPQWASPKFGVFMCLNCSGVHRGLGVHISFIRSATMDSFKVSELKRMQLGGNKPWQDFFDQHADNQLEGKTFEASTIKDRYDSPVGEEYKERLSAKIEGKDFVPGAEKPVKKPSHAGHASVSGASLGGSRSGSRSGTPLGRVDSTSSNKPRSNLGPAAPTQKEKNEDYFARMGAENANRPDNVPPSQGGKFAGFGSDGGAAAPPQKQDEDWMADFSKDPMAGLTKGFGWLGKSAKSQYESVIKPNVQKIQESDFARQAQLNAANFGSNINSAFNRFIEGEEHAGQGGAGGPSSSGGHRRTVSTVDPERRDFWDSFAGGGASSRSPPAEPEKKDFWDAFGAAPRGPAVEKKDFWDSFGAAPKGPAGEKKDFWDSFGDMGSSASKRKSMGPGASIGTSAMGKGSGGGAGGSSAKKEDGEWGDW